SCFAREPEPSQGYPHPRRSRVSLATPQHKIARLVPQDSKGQGRFALRDCLMTAFEGVTPEIVSQFAAILKDTDVHGELERLFRSLWSTHPGGELALRLLRPYLLRHRL